ncbi:DUF4304 domain-containing protein [Prescottella agglutinans]|uniref:DUF4304 domain-containing protein n=1 Tax=Prescottella agglutinans TaxID=1644129 RepID=A0ABT6MIB3_9NOCA|nr:DUF4304 domain-containing protein [Prescottella agglutinans]MDH6284066.1 hypothetical protein [Prescottella agglutinans]
MSTNVVYKAMLRDLIGPGVRAHGFTGTAPRWRKRYPNGDMLILGFQGSRYSTGTEVHFTINYDFKTAGKIEYELERVAAAKGPSAKKRDVGSGGGILTGRLGPKSARTDSSGSWWAVSDERDAQRAADDILPQVASLVGRCDEYAHDRDALLEAVPFGTRGRRWDHAAFVLAERGPSSELDDCLEEYLADLIPRVRPHAERTAAWIRAFADRSSASTA